MNKKLLSLFIFLIFGLAIANIQDEIPQFSVTSSNNNIGEIYDLEAMLGNPNYFHLNESDYPGCENPSFTRATFKITEFKPEILDLQATVGKPTIIESEILNIDYGILVNPSSITQDLMTKKFSKSYTDNSSTSTTHGWKFAGGIKGFFIVQGMQVEYNGSVTRTVESSITYTHEIPGTPIRIPPYSYAIVDSSLTLMQTEGTYTFIQKMGGTMRPRYDRWCGGVIQPDGAKDRPKASINYFLYNNYDLRFFNGNLIPGPLGRIDNTFTLKGTGNYRVKTGTDYIVEIYSLCNKDEIGPKCDPICYTDPKNCPIINNLNKDAKAYSEQKHLIKESTIPFGAHSQEKIIPKETPTLDIRPPF